MTFTAGPHLEGTLRSLLSAGVDLASRFLLPTFLGGKPVKYIFFMLNPSKIVSTLRCSLHEADPTQSQPKLKEASELLSKGQK